MIVDGETLQKEVESLLRRYRPPGQPWVSAMLNLKFNEGRTELYSVVQRSAKPTRTFTSESPPGRKITKNTPVSRGSTSQNHEQCPQTQTASSPGANTNIFQPEMETENSPEIGNIEMEESMTFTTFPEDDVQNKRPEQDVLVMPDEFEQEEHQFLAKRRTEGDTTDEDDDNDSNYEPDSSDAIDEDSKDEPVTNLAISNVRSLTEPDAQRSILSRGGQHSSDGQGILKATKNMKYPCQVCGREFSRAPDLRRHVTCIHGGRKRKWPSGRFNCKECGNPYRTELNLRQHMNVHMADCPFRCNLCQKPWPTRVTLENHIRTHTGEKPFQCPHCGQAFNVNGKLLGHIRTVHRKY